MMATATPDAVVVSTPTETHYEVVRQALARREARALREAAVLTGGARPTRSFAWPTEKKLRPDGRPRLHVQPAASSSSRNWCRTGDLGSRIYYLFARRTNLGPIRSDVNAVLDLASHDVSIYNFLLDAAPTQVSAVGQSFLQPGIQDVSVITLHYPNGVIGSIHVSWLDPKKVREITVVGERRWRSGTTWRPWAR